MLSVMIHKHITSATRGERLRNGVKTVLVGETNVGKSSLLNILCNKPLAIVTPIHGTTRDVLETTLDISGYPVILNDTAGLRSNTSDMIEKEGMERTLKACKEADLVLLIVDSEKYLSWYDQNPTQEFFEFIQEYMKQLNVYDILVTKDNKTFIKQCITIANKSDLVTNVNLHIFDPFEENLISCKSMQGLDKLTANITKRLKLLCGEPSKEHPSMNQVRHREYLTLCLKHLKSFVNDKECFDHNVVLMTEKLRQALRQLDKLTGTFTTEQLLDVIFEEFCIGK